METAESVQKLKVSLNQILGSDDCEKEQKPPKSWQARSKTSPKDSFQIRHSTKEYCLSNTTMRIGSDLKAKRQKRQKP